MLFGANKKPKEGETSMPSPSASLSRARGASEDPSSRSAAGSFRASSREVRPEVSARSAQRPQKTSAAETASKLNPNLKFEGTLHYTGTVLVDCEFRGSIVTDDSLVVGPNADIEAELTAGLVEVSGKVRGNISAKRSVRILSGGEVHGNIETPTIAMEEGVVFEGNCTRPSGPAAPGRSYTAETPRSQPVHEESSTEKAESFSVS